MRISWLRGLWAASQWGKTGSQWSKGLNRAARRRAKGRQQAQELETRLLPATLVVNSLADTLADDSSLTLREAVEVVNLQSSAGLDAGALAQISGTLGTNDTIQFDLALSNETITLSAGEFLLLRSMTITGADAPGLAIDGNATSRIFNIDDLSPGAVITVSLSNLVLFNGSAAAGGNGGAVFNVENLDVSRVLFANNAADGNGGALFTATTGTTSITESTFHQNQASLDGGAVYAQGGNLVISNSTISDNQAQYGGGVFLNGTSSTTITNTTIVFNESVTGDDEGGGLSNWNTPITLNNSIVAGNTRSGNPDDLDDHSPINGFNNLIGDPITAGTFVEGVDGNLVGDGSGGVLAVSLIVDPGTPVGFPVNNGGPTPTHALVPGSRAINAGDNTAATNAGLTTDQRGAGFGRISNSTVDIGAFEVQPTFSPGILAFSAATYSVNENGGSLTITVTRTGGSTGAVSVSYATSNGTAIQPSDYSTTSGTLTFANGQTSRDFTIPISDDQNIEGNETFSVALSGATGGASLGSQASATVTIVDVETISGTVFHDLNLNGTQDVGELGVAGARVELWADFSNGTRDYGVGVGADDILHEFTLTDASGNYQFVNPPSGLTYFIREVVPSPFAATPIVSGAGAGSTALVVVTENGNVTNSFSPYGGGFTGGVRVATGDVNNDGVDDIITAPGSGGSPRINAYSGTDGSVLRSFLAYGSSFLGGVFVASGDVNGDGYDDIITGADAGAGPHVKVFSGQNGSLLASFNAFIISFTGGVRVAAGDVNGDGFDDIITGTGFGATTVTVYNGMNLSQLASFTAYAGASNGVFVAAGDVNGDGFDDIITGADVGQQPLVQVFSGQGSGLLASFFAFDPSFSGGVRVAAGDLNGDGRADIIAGSGPGASTTVRTFDGSTPANLSTFLPFGSATTGAYVASRVKLEYQDGPQVTFSTTSVPDQDIPNALPIDLGDKPHTAGFPTQFSQGGAWHFATGPMLGSSRDTEADGAPSTLANGDDTTGSDDENGVTIPSLLVGNTASITVNASAAGKLDAWMDFNGDGDLSIGEQIATNLTVSAGDNPLSVDVPSTASRGSTYARFRLSTAGNLTPGGGALDGEVEDYRVTILAPSTTLVSSSANPSVFGQSVTFTATVAGPLVLPGKSARVNDNGSVDLTFNPEANGDVFSVVVQSDDKVLLGGAFTSIGGATRHFLVRLNADGSVDNTFNPVIDGSVRTIAVQTNGQIVIGGDFTSVNTQTRNRIARLNADGTLDNTFNPDCNSFVSSVAIQSDGTMVIGGVFTSVNSVQRNFVAKLNSDGTLNNTFIPGTGPDGPVTSVFVQSTGHVVIQGSFTSVNGIPRSRLARLDSNGSLDNSFNPASAANGSIFSVAMQSDDKLVIGGSFTTVSSQSHNHVARLNADGSLDNTFVTGTGASHSVTNVHVQSNGQIVLFGDFASFNGVPRQQIARLNSNGSLDSTLAQDAGIDSGVNSIATQSNGQVLFGGSFDSEFEIPTGTVQFVAGMTPIGAPIILNSGQAMITPSALAVGSHTITVNYAGTMEFAASSGQLIQTVNQANTTATLSSSANPSVFGQSVTFTATVSAVTPGSGTPTGTVTFVDTTTSTPLGTATLFGGVATFTTNTLAPGSHNINANYNGDLNFQASSGMLTQTVGPLTSDLVVAADQSMKAEGTGANSSTPFTFTVTRSGNTSVSTGVSYSISPVGTNPTTPTDFLGTTSGTVSFAPGETAKTITIPVSADSQSEPNETFRLTITSSSPNTNITTGTADQTIVNDDMTPNVEVVNGVLYVRDTTGRVDTITVSLSGTSIFVSDPNNQLVLRLGTTTTVANTASVPLASVFQNKIVFELAGQGDQLTIASSLPSAVSVTVHGGEGNDTVVGGSGYAVINGDAGNDSLSASTGAVSMNGGAGVDVLTGGNANDTINGGTEGDLIVGGGGNDRLNGEAGSDTINGGLGNDTIDGGTEADTVAGDGGTDSVQGGDGDDSIYGDAAGSTTTDLTNTLIGGAGNDQIFGGAGIDIVYGDTTVSGATGGGNDTIYGNAGNDVLRGGSGSDSLFGAAGADSLLGEAGADVMSGGSENDTLYGGAENDSLAGDAGADSLFGEDGTDTLDGGSENDTIVGGNGSDAILGGDGADQLYGDLQIANSTGSLNGNDTIAGGAGNDQIYGGAGNDYLAGQSGADNVRGEAGTDTITGGSGSGPDVGDVVTDTADINNNLVLVFNNMTKLFDIMGV